LFFGAIGRVVDMESGNIEQRELRSRNTHLTDQLHVTVLDAVVNLMERSSVSSLKVASS
jgi:hypothetical protein